MEFLVWLEHTGIANAIRTTRWMYATFETLHYIGLSLLFGGIMLIDFARDINISPAYWSRIERGFEKAPKDSLIIAACERLAKARPTATSAFTPAAMSGCSRRAGSREFGWPSRHGRVGRGAE